MLFCIISYSWWCHFSGPNLNGLFGRQSGTTAGYSYSTANKNMAVIWEEKTLYDYLLNPKKVWINWIIMVSYIFRSCLCWDYQIHSALLFVKIICACWVCKSNSTDPGGISSCSTFLERRWYSLDWRSHRNARTSFHIWRNLRHLKYLLRTFELPHFILQLEIDFK